MDSEAGEDDVRMEPYRIDFARPDVKTLVHNFTVVDMHYHTCHSDGKNRVATIAKKLRHFGIGIAITDHNEIRGAVEMDKYKDVLSIPGIEVTSLEGSHLLVYFYRVSDLKSFYRDIVKPNMGNEKMSSISMQMEDIIRNTKKYKSLSILPHPYSAAYTGVCNSFFDQGRLDRIFRMVDGVEVINAGNLNKWNLKCAVLGFNLQKALTGGSDGHLLSHLGKAVSYAKCRPDRKSFLDSVRKCKNRIVGKEIDILKKMTSNGYKLKTNFRNYPHLVEKNLRYSYSVFNAKSKNLKENFQRNRNERAERKRRA